MGQSIQSSSPPPVSPSLSPQLLTETLPGGIKLELVKIPAGRFTMGSNKYDDEKPLHKVRLNEFYLGKYPVTQEQYQAVMDDNPSYFQDNPKNPVECVDWNAAKAFCQKLKEITGKDFRIPTEAEWEYGCRAGTQSYYFFGDDENHLGNHAWFDKNSGEKIHPVGEKKPNLWGIYDMHGNVWEWCEDNWHENYREKPDDLKFSGNVIWSSSNKSYHVMRGGSWENNPCDCRSASRNGELAISWYSNVGFRLALSLL